MLASPNQQSRSLILTMIAIRLMGVQAARATYHTRMPLITTIAVADGKKGDLSRLDQY
jgi:hypothetical protein